jgi:hypothetical protein
MLPQFPSHLPSIPSITHAASPSVPAHGDVVVVRAFVDFWNFQLAMDRWRHRFRLDCPRLASTEGKREMKKSCSSGSQNRPERGLTG